MTTEEIAIVCDMTHAPDTGEERIAEYRRLFSSPAYLGRRRNGDGIQFRFHNEPGLSEQIRDLVAREKECCAFFDFAIDNSGDTITWDSSVIDDPLAHQILDEYYELPDTATDGAVALFERFTDQGLTVVMDDHGTRRPATTDELGLG